MNRWLAIGMAVSGLMLGVVGAPGAGAARDQPVALPADDAAHPGHVVEWWQWWLHLETAGGHQYGAALVFYSFPLSSALTPAGVGLYRRTDVRITDITGRVFRTASKYSAGPVAPVANGFALDASGQRARGGDGHDQLHLDADEYTLDVAADSSNPAVPIFNPAGVFHPDAAETVHIYERHRMRAIGTVSASGQRANAVGTAWFEHGWGDMPSIAVVQWDYFQLELADGRNIFAARVRRYPGGPVFFNAGTVQDTAGRVTYLQPGAVAIAATGRWKRDASCTYPMGWKVRIRNEQFTVTPTLRNQEVRGAGYGIFWDGDTTITGDAAGRGVAELLNYCFTPDPFKPVI